jgi:hypothetical protein
MASDFYILDDNGEPVPCADTLTWGMWRRQNPDKWKIARDEINSVIVSTVFLCMNHSYGDGPPVLWETMIFGGARDGYQDRYTSRADAVAGHAKAIEIASRTRAIEFEP